MIDGLRPYTAMKDSGVPWLGEVPEHWEVRRLKYICDLNSGVLPEDTDPDFEFDYIDISAVASGRLVKPPQRLRFASAPSRARRVVAAGDTIVATVRPYLRAVYHVGSHQEDMICSTGFSVLRPRGVVSPEYVGHLAQSDPFTHQLVSASTGIAYPAVTDMDVGLAPVPLPPLPEQAAIVRFLDHADGRVRRYIRAKQKLIKLLEEQKQAIIHRAVTRGLDPDVRLKPSGVEWLGDVPEPWEVVQLRWLIKPGTSITYGIVQAGPDLPDGVPYIRTSDMRGASLPTTGYLRTSPEIDASYRRSRVEPGDLVVAIRASLGKGLLVPKYLAGANLTQGTAKVSPGPLLLPAFLRRAFNAPFCQRQIASVAKGTTFREITLQALRRVVVTVPPLGEQQAIAAHLEEAVKSIDGAVELSAREITLLREYRTRLIADVVTGKLDVREAAAHLPDEADGTDLMDDPDESTGDDDALDDSDLSTDPEEIEA